MKIYILLFRIAAHVLERQHSDGWLVGKCERRSLARKRNWPRCRGGLTTKIHALTDAHGLPLEFVLTPGQAGDCPVAEHLLGWLRPNTIVLADKAYDAD